MRITVYDAQTAREASAQELPVLLEDQNRVTWVDIRGPEEDGLRAMQQVFRFHPLAIEDTRNQEQRPKVEEYPGYLFTILNAIEATADGVDFREVDIFLGPNYLVTVHLGEEPVLEEAHRRLEHAGPKLAASAEHLFYVILDATIDSYFPVIDMLEEQIDALGDRIMTRPGQATLAQLFALKRQLIDIWRVVWPQREALNSLAHYRTVFMSQDDLRYYMRDASDHLIWVADMVNTLRDTLTSMMDLYMSATSNRLNYVVNRLTVFTVIIGLSTVLSGFYGMNFLQTWPPFSSPWGVVFVLGLMVAVAGALLYLFRRLGWY